MSIIVPIARSALVGAGIGALVSGGVTAVVATPFVVFAVAALAYGIFNSLRGKSGSSIPLGSLVLFRAICSVVGSAVSGAGLGLIIGPIVKISTMVL